MVTARSRNWSESACIVEVKNDLRCLGRRAACRAACRGNGGGRLSPADNILSDHAHARLRETNRKDHGVQHIISQCLVLQQHTLLELQLVGVLALRQTKSGLQVLGQVLLLLDGGNDGLVNSLLVASFRLWEWFLLLGLAIIKELFLC